MRRSLKKASNRVEGELEQRRSPVVKDHERVPIADAILDYRARGTLTFGIPAHNGGRGQTPSSPRGPARTRRAAACRAATGSTRATARGKVRSTAQELFAEAMGAKERLFSTNGSSLSVHVAMMAVAGPGDTLVTACNGHTSAFTGLVLSVARPVYVDASYDDDPRSPTRRAPRAAGRISAEVVTPYPPGIPAVAPSEVYTDAIVDSLEEAAAGGFVEGAADQALSTLRVVAAGGG